MNTAHLHLILNHFPIIGTIIGALLLGWGLLRKQPALQASAAGTLFIMALLAIPVYLTGEPAEELVEEIAGVSKGMIEAHEEAADIAMGLMVLTGLVAAAAWWMQRQQKAAAHKFFQICFVLSLITFAAMARTGYYGGQIRHTELNSSTIQAGENNNGGENKTAGEEDDD